MFKLTTLLVLCLFVASVFVENEAKEYELEVISGNMAADMNDKILQVIVDMYMKNTSNKQDFLLRRLKKLDRTADWTVNIDNDVPEKIDGIHGNFRVNDQMIKIVGRNKS